MIILVVFVFRTEHNGKERAVILHSVLKFFNKEVFHTALRIALFGGLREVTLHYVLHIVEFRIPYAVLYTKTLISEFNL